MLLDQKVYSDPVSALGENHGHPVARGRRNYAFQTFNSSVPFCSLIAFKLASKQNSDAAPTCVPHIGHQRARSG